MTSLTKQPVRKHCEHGLHGQGHRSTGYNPLVTAER